MVREKISRGFFKREKYDFENERIINKLLDICIDSNIYSDYDSVGKEIIEMLIESGYLQKPVDYECMMSDLNSMEYPGPYRYTTTDGKWDAIMTGYGIVKFADNDQGFFMGEEFFSNINFKSKLYVKNFSEIK